MVLLLWVALVGGTLSGVLAAMTHGVLVGVLAAPLGASLLTLLAGLLLARHASSSVDRDEAFSAEADEQVRALRQVLQDVPSSNPVHADSRAA